MEFVIQDKVEDVLKLLVPGQGYELLRIAARKFDPQAPNMKQHIKGQFYALPNDTCNHFAAVWECVALLDKLSSEFAVVFGDLPDDDFFAEML